MRQYLAVIILEKAYESMPIHLGIFDDYEKAKAIVERQLEVIREETYDDAFGWVVEFEVNKLGHIKKTLIGTV